jgi:hypothetical protein
MIVYLPTRHRDSHSGSCRDTDCVSHFPRQRLYIYRNPLETGRVRKIDQYLSKSPFISRYGIRRITVDMARHRLYNNFQCAGYARYSWKNLLVTSLRKIIVHNHLVINTSRSSVNQLRKREQLVTNTNPIYQPSRLWFSFRN